MKTYLKKLADKYWEGFFEGLGLLTAFVLVVMVLKYFKG